MFAAAGLRVTCEKSQNLTPKTLIFANLQIRQLFAEERQAQIHPPTNRREPSVCASRTERTERQKQPVRCAKREARAEQSLLLKVSLKLIKN